MRTFAVTCAVSTALACISTGALAQTRNFDVPAGSLARALDIYVKQTQAQLIYRVDDVASARTRGAKGEMTAQQALSQLLAGTGFETTRDPSGAIAIVRRANTSVLPSAAAQSRAQFQPAAEEKPAASIGLEEIVVTAQKRPENVQDTPISVAVLGAKELDQRGISGFSDLANGAVPALKIAPLAGRSSAYNVTMRGISASDAAQISRDPGVGIYIDGVYLGRAQGLGFEFFDIDRIEVLRGPQGTLFGRNAVGGALNVISKRPSGRLEFDGKASISNYQGWDLAGHLSLPEFANVSIKLDGMFKRRDGWVRNPLSGRQSDEINGYDDVAIGGPVRDWGEYRRWGFRAQALWQAMDNLDLLYSFDLSRDRSTPFYSHLQDEVSPGAVIAPFFSLEPHRAKVARIGVPLAFSIAKIQGHALTANLRLSEQLTLRSITSYRKLTQSQDDNDMGYTSAFRPNGNFARRSLAFTAQDQFSQELQLIGEVPTLKYVFGAFYFDENAHDSAYAAFSYRWNATGTDFIVNDSPVGGTPPDRASRNSAKSTALFGQATWTPPILGDRLHFTAGGRWTHDRKHGTLDLLRGVPAGVAYRLNDKRIDPMFIIGYDLSDEISTYVKYGSAYRAGGANSRSLIFRTFGPDEVRSWELGFKSQLFDRKLRFNVAAFDMEYRDVQVDFNNLQAVGTVDTVNSTKSAKIRGIEADIMIAPALGLILGGSYSYLKTDFPTVVNPFGGNLVEVIPTFAPKHSGTVSVDYELPVALGTLRLHADGNFSSKFRTLQVGVPSRGYFITNARITLADIKISSGPSASFALYGKNLFDEEYEVSRNRFAGPGLNNLIVAHLNEPRTYGIEAAIKF